MRAGDLARLLQERLTKRDEAGSSEIAYNRSTVAARLGFEQTCALVLPVSDWWYRCITKPNQLAPQPIDPADDLDRLADLGSPALDSFVRKPQSFPATPLTRDITWIALTVGALLRSLQTEIPDEHDNGLDRRKHAWSEILDTPGESLRKMAQWFREMRESYPASEAPLVYSANRNRILSLSVCCSCQTIKADAASRMFAAGCAELTWAVMDSGIDATHPAFRLRGQKTGCMLHQQPFELSSTPPVRWMNRTRVKATYDFSGSRRLMAVDGDLARA